MCAAYVTDADKQSTVARNGQTLGWFPGAKLPPARRY
jgi:hypothetical protein